jgi:tetratricopeptide (TPR) repeat protein
LQSARARGLTRFVGRQTELTILQAALAQAGAGHGQVVAVLGEAGVGKSRLVDECVQAAHTAGWLVLDSTAVSYGQATPYGPVLDLLRRYCRLEEGADAGTIQAKVTEQVLTLDAALHATLPALLALLDALPADSPFLRLDAPQRRQRTFAALKVVFLRQSQVQPLLLVCEDLHWLDTETQALLDSLIESLPTARLLLLVNYRPDYRHGWGSKTYYTQVRLDPLSLASADAFLRALLGEDPSLTPLTQRLIQRTEGNPFFLEESVRALVETGVLVGEPGTYRVAQALPPMQVPATVQAVLAARIDRLSPEEKHLLQTAAVLGMEVPLALLQAVVELPEEALRRSLAHLQAAEFLYEASLFPELVYTFKHALTQEVAYGSLLQEQRRVLHARIVAILETLAGDRKAEGASGRSPDQVDQLAHHALRGEVWEKALAYYWQAGNKAAMHSAHREAVACFDHALVALRHLPENQDTLTQAIDLRFALRQVLFPLGELERILDDLRQVEALAETLGDQRRLGYVYSYMTNHYRLVGAYDHAVASGQRALALATDLGDVALQVMIHEYLGQLYFPLGHYEQAIGFFKHNVTCLTGGLVHERFGLAGFPSVVSRSYLTRCLAEVGAFPEGMAIGQEAIQIAEAANHPYSCIAAYGGVGLLSLRQGALLQATSMLKRGLELCKVANLPIWFAATAAGLGRAYALAGRLAEALRLLQHVVEQSLSRLVYPLCMIHLSEAYLLAGRVDDARILAGRALETHRTSKQRGYEAYALHLLGDIAGYRTPPDAELTAAYYRPALALAEALGMRPLQAHCHRGLGTLHATIGQQEQARAELSAAIVLYRAMDMTFWLPQAEAALAQVAAASAPPAG